MKKEERTGIDVGVRGSAENYADNVKVGNRQAIPWAGKNKRLPMRAESVVVGFVLSFLLSPPVWASSYWQQISHEIATKAYASEHFLYASRPNVKTCHAGALTQQAKNRALSSMNRIRALHGLASVKYSTLYDRSVQEAALIQAANGFPGHYPSVSVRCYTAAGKEESRGNLSGGSKNTQRATERDPADKMMGWTHDARNRSLVAAAGHRRWILDPFVAYLSYGHVAGYAVQKTKNFDREPAVTPFITVDYVAFPYKTYPAILMEDDPPWSFSVIENKTDKWENKHPYFQLAAVTVTRVSDGTQLPVGTLYMDTKGYGVPNFLSWQVQGWEYDTPYQVTIRNVAMQTRQLRTYSYPVTISRTGQPPASPMRTQIRVEQEPRPTLTARPTPPPVKRRPIVSREAREREARAAARAARRLREAQR